MIFTRLSSYLLIVACLLAFSLAASSSLAQAQQQQAQQADTRLTNLEQPVRENPRARALRDESLALAKRVRELERLIVRLDEHLTRLAKREKEERARLLQHYDRLAQVLQTLLFLERSPEWGLFLHPNDALAAHRGQRLVAHLAPHSARTAKLLERDLRRIGALQREIDRKKEQLSAHLEDVAAHRQRIARLSAHKRRLLPLTAKERTALKTRAQSLAEEARSVQALVARLEVARLNPSGSAPRTLRVFPASAKNAGKLGENSQNKLGRLKDRRVQVVSPAEGAWLQRYGSSDGHGQTLSGIVIETEPATTVLAAFDGRVVFAEVFRDQGKLLIVEHKGGYHTVTANLSALFVSLGQWVLAGEPVGRMGAQKGRLYFEVRQKGKPRDPRRWLRETPRRRAFLQQ